MNNSIKQKVLELIKSNTSIIYEDFDFENSENLFLDLNYDSLVLMQLVIAIEDEFGIVFDGDVEIDEINTLEKMVSYIQERKVD